MNVNDLSTLENIENICYFFIKITLNVTEMKYVETIDEMNVKTPCKIVIKIFNELFRIQDKDLL